jgi:hypothetical protein
MSSELITTPVKSVDDWTVNLHAYITPPCDDFDNSFTHKMPLFKMTLQGVSIRGSNFGFTPPPSPLSGGT